MSRKSSPASQAQGNNSLAERIADLAVELAGELVRIPSESSAPVATDAKAPEAGVAAALAAFCQQHGLPCSWQEVAPDRCNLVVRRPKAGAPSVVLAAHMDTVSAAGMRKPFAAEVRDGRLWGRGACDDKGPLALAAAVVACLPEPAFDLTLLATVDEECSLAGAAAAAARLPPFDLCVALEPTECRVITAHKGVLRLALTTPGRAVHSSEPEKGENAISKMAPVIMALDALHQELQAGPMDAQLGTATVTVTTVRGGGSVNVVPDRCAITVDIRLLPDMTAGEMLARVQRCVGSGTAVEVLFSGAGMRTPADCELARRLLQAVRDCGGDDRPAGAAFATDCSQLAARGPCVVWGPGSIRQAHQQQEWISLDDIRRAAGILTAFLCG